MSDTSFYNSTPGFFSEVVFDEVVPPTVQRRRFAKIHLILQFGSNFYETVDEKKLSSLNTFAFHTNLSLEVAPGTFSPRREQLN